MPSFTAGKTSFGNRGGSYTPNNARPTTTPRAPWQPPPTTVPEPPSPLPNVQINPLPQAALPPRGNVNSLGIPIEPFVPEPPPTTNPVPRIAPPSGGTSAVITTTAGGVITGAGLLTGGLTVVAGALLLHDARQLLKLFELSQPESKPTPQTLRGGQDPNISYSISGSMTEICTPHTGNPVTITWIFNKAGNFSGPITILRKPSDIPYGDHSRLDTLLTFGKNQLQGRIESEFSTIDGQYINNFGITFGGTSSKLISINLVAIPIGKTDPEPEIQPKRRSPVKSGITPSPTPQSVSSPNPTGVRSPTSPPPAKTPLATNNRLPYTITTPGSNPITITSPGATPVTITPTTAPATIKITRPSASPFLTPSSASTPAAIPVTTPIGDPVTTPAGVPIAVSSPGTTPTKLVMPGTNPITITYPGQEPIVFDPSGSKPPQGVQALPFPQPGAFTTTAPAALPQTPSNPVTTPTTPTTPTKPKETPNNPFADIKDPDVAKIGLGLVGITQLLQGIVANTTPPAIANAVCRTTQPGGCGKKMTDNAVNQGNQDLKQFLTNQLPNIIGSGANAAIGLDTNARVKKVEADTAKIRESTGSDRYPMVLPEYLLDDFIDKPVQIPDQVAYNVWLLKQIDALVGLFPIKIERTDENGEKQLLKFENIAEAIAELTGLLAQIAFDADTAVNIGTRATGEAVGAKAAALQAGSYLKAITDYMGFQGQAVSIDVPISVTPGAVGLDGKLQESELKDFLKPSIQKTIGFKNTDPVDQRLVMRRILESGEISRAALFKPLKTDPTQNPLTGDAIKADKTAELKRINDLWEAFKLRMEKHTAGTKVDIDDGVKPKDLTP